ncbi:MAG: hypothetical protein JSS62_04330 [Verrucomicrobia bacterium]|nr:hypothetical protein [Verrucomicrobiota bacterium]MBS0646272.1 hypothetical protein [Verrucomicrobiota bacterium]
MSFSTSGPGAIPSTPTDYSALTTNVATGKAKVKGQDSIARIDSTKHVDTIASAPVHLERPHLPSATSQVPQALIFIAEAFAAIFAAMASASNVDLQVLAQDQNLNLTQSQGVLDTTNTKINKEEKELQEYNKIKSEEDNPWMKILQVVLGVIMAAIIVATIISGIVDGGASEAAVPEEIAGAAAAEGAVEGGAGASMASVETSFMAAEATQVGGEATAATSASAEAGGSSVANASQMIETNLDDLVSQISEEGASEAGGEAGALGGETAESSTMEASQSVATSQLSGSAQVEGMDVAESEEAMEEAIAKQAAAEGGSGTAATQGVSTATRVLIGLIAGAMGGLPDLVKGIQSIKLKGMYEDLAKLQKEVGEASRMQSLANSYFQFLQTACQRTSQIASSQINAGSDVIKAYTDILATYQQAATTARQSVV